MIWRLIFYCVSLFKKLKCALKLILLILLLLKLTFPSLPSGSDPVDLAWDMYFINPNSIGDSDESDQRLIPLETLLYSEFSVDGSKMDQQRAHINTEVLHRGVSHH